MNAARSWTRLGLGTGRLASIGRGTTEDDVKSLIASCLDLGVLVIDTADSYTSGRCEALLGKALRPFRDQFTLVSKAGYRYGDFPQPFSLLNPFYKKACQKLGRYQNFDPDYLRHSATRSLQRLGTSYLDGFLLHDATIASLHDPKVISVLKNLKSRGSVRAVGISTDNPQVARIAIDDPLFEILQTPANPETFPVFTGIWADASARGIQIMANHVFYTGRTKSFPATDGRSIHEHLLRAACEQLPDATILVGTRNVRHMRDNVRWSGQPISPIT